MTYKVLIGSLCLVAVILLAGIMLLVPKKPEFGTLDTAHLISLKAQDLARKSPNDRVSQHRIRQATEDMQFEINLWCKAKNVVLLSKGMVMGGQIPDYTPEIVSYLNLDEAKW